MPREQVKVRCQACAGLGFVGEWSPRSADYDSWPCAECEGDGEVPARCITCRVPAFQLVGPLGNEDPVCDACAAMCTLCETWTPPDDRLPWGDRGALVHTACALGFDRSLLPDGAQNLETTHASEETVFANSERARARSRAHRHLSVILELLERRDRREPEAGEITAMPKPSERLVKAMRQKGFVPSMEAVERSGHSLTTIYDWIKEKRLKGERSGLFHFVEEASLNKCCPQTKRAS